MELQEVVRHRRMVRSYDTSRPIQPDVIDCIVRNGLRAPSAGFSQGWGFLVLDNPADLARFRDAVRPDADPEEWFERGWTLPHSGSIPATGSSPGADGRQEPAAGAAGSPEVRSVHGRIGDYALLGDTQTAALVSRDGSIDWMCPPRFDSPACFAAILGGSEHGRWLLAPTTAATVRRRYRGDTLVLETDYECPEGAVTVVDTMPPAVGGTVRVVRLVIGRGGQVPDGTGPAVRLRPALAGAGARRPGPARRLRPARASLRRARPRGGSGRYGDRFVHRERSAAGAVHDYLAPRAPATAAARRARGPDRRVRALVARLGREVHV